MRSLPELDAAVAGCRACPRLVAWREGVAGTKAAFRGEEYWARPVPGFGPPDASLAVVGLAPSAHGANRTGRMFTGDPSGDFLFRVLHEVELASQPTSTAIGDGLRLYGTRLVSPVRCAPPENKPTPAERDTCRPWLAEELALLRPTLRAIVVLGAFGWQALLPVLEATGWPVPQPRPAFAHGAVVELGDLRLFGCYHVSPRNVQTHRVTHAMVADVFRAATSVTGHD
ncbi:uracil-DNA glycosylase [Amycolatopsis sp. NPDC058278]|uniref:uracil-DNA glycosylase n=1 Tax=Amycolatopsis sp. NPDC058278 TaxID=3346417 RepID=UPI0036D7F67D